MDYLPYDIHEHIFRFIHDKIDMFCYADAYESADLWKFCTLRLTKGIKNMYNKPREVTYDNNIFKEIRLFESYDNRKKIIICPCGCDFNFGAYAPDSKIRARINNHIKTKIHKKNMVNPNMEYFKKLISCNSCYELVNRL